MKRLKVLVLLPLLLLTGCADKQLSTDLTEYDKVHIMDVGCVATKDCNLYPMKPVNYDNGTVVLEYTISDSNKIVTPNFILVKGRCPICKK